MYRKRQKITIENIAKSVGDLALITKRGFEQVDKRFEKIEKRLTGAEAVMVTKDYLDDKLADLKGDIITIIKGDRERDQIFKTKILEIIQRNKLARRNEIKLLAGLIK